jgi:1A family penicillin-binding protein
MFALNMRLQHALTYLKKMDTQYFKDKWQKLRNLKKEDVVHFVKKNRKLVMYAFLTGVVIMLAIPVATYAYFVRDLASKDKIINKKNDGVVLLDREDKPFFTLFDATTKNPIEISSLPKHTTQAFVAVEDKDFYTHPGFSITGFVRAVEENLLSRSYSQGGSTISQQLIKNAILYPDKQLLRKYQELVLAIELERRYDKDDILEMYLNTIYFGEGAYGIQDAAKSYFSKDAKDLTLSESALLAGVIRAPSALSPISGDAEAAIKRRNLILQLMTDQKYITEAQKNAAQKEKLVLKPTEDDINEEAVHFALMIQDMLIEEYGEQDVANAGYTVKTTLDIDLQKKAQTAVETQVKNLKTSLVGNGAAVAIDPNTGEVLALVGSHDWSDEKMGKINMAIRPRQPGSSFKPIVYAKALDDRTITASTQIADEAISFGSYTPKNYDNRFRGKVLIRYALANSLNIPAVHVLNMIGVKSAVDMAQKMGITALDENRDYGLPLVLGSAEVPLIEMTNAYAVFADEGTWHDYSIFTEVRDKNGKVILENEPSSRRAISDATAYIISAILSDAKARADTFGGALTISRQAAVKTGTTNDYKDALTIGYTPQIVVGVWIGNNDNTPMNSIAGSLGAAPIWRQIMEAYLADKPAEYFKKPTTVVDERVCFEDGLKVEKDYATTSAYVEFFVKGTAPKKICSAIPSPTPTEDPEKKKRDEEEKKKKEEEEKKKNATPTPQPTSTATPSPTQGAISSPSPSPTSVISITPTVSPTTVIPTL